MSDFLEFLQSEEVLTLDGLKGFTATQQTNIKQLILTDVWWAAQHIFRSALQPPLRGFHQDICNALPQPSPDLPFAEWSEIKEAAILAFRGAAKTTIISGYVAQCILCAPDIRIRFVGGTLPKAAELVDMVRFHFNGSEVIRYLFPDFCNISRSGSDFISPARKNLSLRDPTLASTSFRAANAGGRADILVLDDAATESNMSTSARVAKSVSQYDDLAPLVERGGYTIFNGTRWAEDDIPQSMAESAEANGTELTWLEIPVFNVKTDQPNQAEIDGRNAEHKLNLATDVIFIWPEKWNARTLLTKYLKPNFDSQYLLKVGDTVLRPASTAARTPTPELLHAFVCLPSTPSETETFVMNGDLASVSEEGKDPCAIVAGIWNPAAKHLTISEIILEKFTEEKTFLESVRNMHENCVLNTVNAVSFRIENVREAKALFQAKFNALNIPVDFQYPSFDRSAREKRVLKLFSALNAGQVHFSQICGHWNDVIEQFCFYNARQTQKHMDLLDSIAQLWEYCESLTTLVHVGLVLPPAGSFDFDYATGAEGGFKRDLSWQDREMQDSGFTGSWSQYQDAISRRNQSR